MKRTTDQLPTAKNKLIGASLSGAESSPQVKTDSKLGLKWDPKRLAAIPAEWSGDEILDGSGLVGEIRVAKNNAVSVCFQVAKQKRVVSVWYLAQEHPGRHPPKA
jgi:hypothetical protein